MNSSGTSVDLPEIRITLRDSITAGINSEGLIRAMRQAGLNQIDCIKMLRELIGISLGDAKEAVHYSQAWADRREMNETLHAAAFRAADGLGFVETTG